jgi:transaldolase
MKIFVDSAKLSEIKEACSWGIVDGVTTNPSLIKKAVEELKEGSMEDYIKEILKIVNGPVSLEVVGLTQNDMLKQAKFLHNAFNNINNNIVIKIPINTNRGEGKDTTYDGLKVVKNLTRLGIKTNVTLVMTPEQALLAAKAGATYVSPFAGRIDDYIRSAQGIKFEKQDYFNAEGITKKGSCEKVDDKGIYSGVDLVKKIVKIYKNYNIPTEVIAASIRNARQAREVAEAGADIATIPFSVIRDMLEHPKTVEGIKKFLGDTVPEYSEMFK